MDVLLRAALGMAVLMGIMALLYGAVALMHRMHGQSAGTRSIVPLPPLPTPIAEPTASAPQATAPPQAVTLIDTDEATAAVIMAIVIERSGIPLERLEFRRIRRIGGTP